jgi:hypothetical protein
MIRIRRAGWIANSTPDSISDEQIDLAANGASIDLSR